ncbi:hypothetical protein IC582_016617 [Cucumis melo]
MGNWVSELGVQVDQEKIQAMNGWPVPKNVPKLCAFLGLTGYYRRFIKDYGTIAAPLTQLLQKNALNWSAIATEAFNKLKEAMMIAPALALPDLKRIFEIETDALGFSLGAVLMQDQK